MNHPVVDILPVGIPSFTGPIREAATRIFIAFHGANVPAVVIGGAAMVLNHPTGRRRTQVRLSRSSASSADIFRRTSTWTCRTSARSAFCTCHAVNGVLVTAGRSQRAS
jgi:hypothetical protein